MTNPRKFRVSAADEGTSVEAFVEQVLSLPLSLARERVRSGAVSVNQRRVGEGVTLAAGDKVVVHELSQGVEVSLERLFEGNGVLVFDKPAGVPSQATRSSAAHTADAWVMARHPKARLLHRLDSAVPGPLMFTLPAAHKRMADELAAGRIKRSYRAVVHGSVTPRTVDVAVGPDSKDRRRQRAGVGRAATTHIRRVEAVGAHHSLVDLDLVTGRTHQIRVHLAHIGHPVVGDPLYGMNEGEQRPLALAAVRLAWSEGAVESVLAPRLLKRVLDILS